MNQRSESARLVRARKPEILVDLYGWGADVFEEICCDLFFDEVGVKNPERYGRPRQKQFGVDLVADRRDGTGIDALSCKCYKSIRPEQIRKFADEFLDHWGTHWATQCVRRFILCIACDLRGLERRAEIQAEKRDSKRSALSLKSGRSASSASGFAAVENSLGSSSTHFRPTIRPLPRYRLWQADRQD